PEQEELEPERRIAGELCGVSDEHEPAGRYDQEQARARPGQKVTLHARHRKLPREAEQPQFEHRRAADEDDEADDMQDLDDRIEPERLPHRRRRGGRLEPAGPTDCPGLRHRSSTVAPSIVMRSARISSALLRWG